MAKWGSDVESVNPKKLIRLSKSSIGNAEKRAVEKVLDHEYLGMGAEVKEFEERLELFFERPAVCIANGTAALHLALEACDIGLGDEVLVQSLTYVASFQAISATGAVPIACDIDPSSLTIDCDDMERRLTARTKAVMPVHYSGGAGALEQIYAFSRRHGLRVIEDAAHAFGTVYQGQRIGGFGDIACFSFDGIKNITSGEGGCIVTDDKEVLQKVKDARLLGVERDTSKRYAGRRSWDFSVSRQGWRYHMSNIMASIGLTQIERFSDFATKRRQLARLYDSLLSQCSHIQSIPHDYASVVPHIYVVRIKGLLNRKALRDSLEKSGIQTGVHYQPNHTLSLYCNPHALPLPTTDLVYPELVSLPLHPELTEDDAFFICSKLVELVTLEKKGLK